MLVVFHLILYVPSVAHAEDEFVVFKLIVNKAELSQVETIFYSNKVYVSVPEFIGKLGYRYQYDSAANTFAMCCPDKTNCFQLHADTLFTASGKSLLPDSLLLVRTENLYLRSDYFEKLCGIQLEIIFQSFKIDVKSNHVFPFETVREQEFRRHNFKANGEKNQVGQIDTIPLRRMRFNTLGYALTGSFSKNGLEASDIVLSTNAEILGGALNLNYNYSAQKVESRQELNFRHMYEFDRRWVRQFSVFRQSSTLLMSNLDGYANGIYLSNDNAMFFNRRYYLYKSRTRPNSNVEIYSNGELASFVTADSLGNFEAIVPVTDGANTLSAVTVNEYGESASDQQSVYVSPDLLSHKQFRYQFSSGISDNGKFFSGMIIEYGLTPFLTMMSRMETMANGRHSSLLAGAGIKFSLWRWLQGGGEYYPQLKYKLLLTGSTNRYLGYNVVYEEYRKNQRLLPLAPLRDLRGSISGEIPFSRLHNSLTFSLRDIRYRSGSTFTSSLRLNIFKANLLFTGHVSTASPESFLFENFSYGARVGYRIKQDFYNELSYDCQAGINEHIFRNRFQFKLTKDIQGYVMADYYVRARLTNAELGITYRIPWATFRGGVRSNFPGWNMNIGAEGAMRLYPDHNMGWENRNSLGACLHVVVFADTNGNQVYDKGEPILPEAKVIVKTGAEVTRKSTGIYFRNIAPGYAFKVLIPRQPLTDISWQIVPFEKILYLSSGQSHSLYIPVQVISEISGEVYSMEKEKRKTIQGIIIKLIRQSDNYTVKEQTDEWGNFYFTSLTPGTYTIEMLSNRSPFTSMGKPRTIVIPESNEGVQIEGVDFEITL